MRTSLAKLARFTLNVDTVTVVVPTMNAVVGLRGAVLGVSEAAPSRGKLGIDFPRNGCSWGRVP